jgi:hypothetical protein
MSSACPSIDLHDVVATPAGRAKVRSVYLGSTRKLAGEEALGKARILKLGARIGGYYLSSSKINF